MIRMELCLQSENDNDIFAKKKVYVGSFFFPFNYPLSHGKKKNHVTVLPFLCICRMNKDAPKRELMPVDDEYEEELKGLLETHIARTGSALAQKILSSWETSRVHFVQVQKSCPHFPLSLEGGSRKFFCSDLIKPSPFFLQGYACRLSPSSCCCCCYRHFFCCG